MTWFRNCVKAEEKTKAANPNDNPAVPEVRASVDAKFKVTDTRLYVTLVTLSTEDDNNKLLEQYKQDAEELLNGINMDQKCWIRLKLTV